MGDAETGSKIADYGTVSGRGRGFMQKEPKSPVQSLRKSIENAVQRIRKNTESLRTIGLRLRTNSRSPITADLCENVNTIIRGTLEIVEQCLSDLRSLRRQMSDVLVVSEAQQRVSVAVNDFQRLSQEVMLSLQNTGSGSSRSRRRRKNKYRGFYDSESEGGLSDSSGRSFKYKRVSSPEQDTLITTFPSGQVEISDMEGDLQVLNKIMNDIKTLSTEEEISSHHSTSLEEIEKPRSTPTDQQIQVPYPYPHTSIEKSICSDFQPKRHTQPTAAADSADKTKRGCCSIL